MKLQTKFHIIIYCLLHMQLWISLADESCISLPNFPPTIQIVQETFQNWDKAITVPNLWKATPSTESEVVEICNWAAKNGFKVRASGFSHNWSPLTVIPQTTCSSKVILVKTEKLNRMEIISSLPNAAVRVGAGASLNELTAFLEQNDLGLMTTTAPGDVSIGGILSVDAHGSAIPTEGEGLTPPPGFTYGSFSNLVIEFTAVVWNFNSKKYDVKSFDRSDPEAKAFLTSLGRTFLIDVTLRVGPNYNLRCVSRVDIPWSELFAPSSSQGLRTVDSFLKESGRFEIIWLPYTDKPWLKVWKNETEKPGSSKEITAPYPYPFFDRFPDIVMDLTARAITGNSGITPLFSNALFTQVKTGLFLTHSSDVWGPSKNTLLYLRPTTFRVDFAGFVVLTPRSNFQNVLHQVTYKYEELLQEYKQRGLFPVSGAMEIRATGMDWPSDVDVDGAEAPSLSVIRPIDGHPEIDTAVWFNVLTFPGTKDTFSFMRDLEEFAIQNMNDGVNTFLRPEWSKSFGFSEDGAWHNFEFINEMHDFFESEPWLFAVSTLRKYDPNHLFTNEFLNALNLTIFP